MACCSSSTWEIYAGNTTAVGSTRGRPHRHARRGGRTKYARRFAQHDLSLESLLRAYRVGEHTILQWVIQDLSQRAMPLMTPSRSPAALNRPGSDGGSTLEWRI